MERVIKGLMGYNSEKEGKPATHVILTVEEYEDLIGRIRTAKYTAEQTEIDSKRKMENYKKQCDLTLNEEQKKAEESIRTSQELLNRAKGEIDRLNDLNANLLRISRERANAKRGLKPKKTHHGYIVLDSKQQTYNFHYIIQKRSTTYSFPCWKIRIQTPYNSSIEFKTVTPNIENDLIEVFGGSLGIDKFFLNGYLDKRKLTEVQELWDKADINFIFKTSYKSNYKTGLWEVEYLVKASVIVPKDMRTK